VDVIVPHRLVLPILLAVLIGPAVTASAQTVTVVGWNTESGDAHPDTIAHHMGLHFGAVDVWGFTEIMAEWADALETGAEAATGADYARVVGTTGGADRMMILYNDDRFDLVATDELHHINTRGRVRAPLVVELVDVASGTPFTVMVNHLYRSDADARLEQSRQLNAWAEATGTAVIAVGDYNYDWETEGGDTDHDAGYDALVEAGIFEWVRPATLVRTQCSTRTRSDGTEYCYYDSVLDFVFVAGDAKHWPATASIVTWPGDLPDDELHPDHRPTMATFTIGDTAAPVIDAELRARLLEHLEALEREIAAIRAMIGGR
jgi:hypothetical protein